MAPLLSAAHAGVAPSGSQLLRRQPAAAARAAAPPARGTARRPAPRARAAPGGADGPQGEQPQQQPQAQPPQQQQGYYSGLITSGLERDNGASSGDMLKRSLQLAGAPERGSAGGRVRSSRTGRSRGRPRAPRHTALPPCPWPTPRPPHPPTRPGGIGGVLVALTLAFLASNGLLG
jgi:hypothetical protein